MSLVVLAMIAVAFCAKVESVGNVAFLAKIQNGYILEQDQVVKYDRVVTNVGNAFDKSTNVFTATKRGIYVFHINTLTNLNTRISLGLFHNDANIVTVTADVPNNYGMGGNTAVLSLERRDRVYVKTYTASNFYSGSYTTFSGYMIELGDGEE
ncbi:hypothetical protein BsWGS_15471 [Bradybaena similaris]